MLDVIRLIMDHRSADLDPRKYPDAGTARKMAFNGPWSEELPAHLLLEGLFMVATGVRPSSFYHPSSEREIALLNGAARELGLGMRVRLAGSKVHKVWLSGPRNFGLIETLPDITEDIGPREFIAAQIGLANMTGKFLGYPECCVRSFVEHLLAGTDQDLEAMESFKGHPEPDPRAYFVERFVPCRPDCPEAIKEGDRIEQELGRLAPALLPMYRTLRTGHIEEVRSGAVIREKRARDHSLKEAGSG